MVKRRTAAAPRHRGEFFAPDASARRSAGRRGVRLGPALGLVLALLPAQVLAAEGADAAALRQQVEQLKRTVERLNEKVDTLERQRSPTASAQATGEPPATPPPTLPAPGAAATPLPGISERWGQLRRGMTTTEVEKLLGRPARILTLNAQPVWYYTYTDVGGGSVAFTLDGRVQGWQRPPFRLWWW